MTIRSHEEALLRPKGGWDHHKNGTHSNVSRPQAVDAEHAVQQPGSWEKKPNEACLCQRRETQ